MDEPDARLDALIACYRQGVFPMAESKDDPGLFLVDPPKRGIIPLDGLHISRRLARTLRSGRFELRFDTAFEAVLDACAARPETWINEPIRELYLGLHARGQAHSVEALRDGALAGGLYGVSVGGAFFGESMFSRARDASKAALAGLVARLKAGGYVLLDTQFMTDHLASLGAVEISRTEYRDRLGKALEIDAAF